MAELSDEHARAMGIAAFALVDRLLDELLKRGALKPQEIAEVIRRALGPPVVPGSGYRLPEEVAARLRSKVEGIVRDRT